MCGNGRLVRGLLTFLLTASLVLTISGIVFCDQNNGPIVTASAGPNGSISPSGDVLVEPGGSQTFRMTPARGYQVDDVLVNGRSVGAVTSYRFSNLNEDASISVTFAHDAIRIIVFANGPGRITPRHAVDVPYGADQVFTMTPIAGFILADVQIDGVSIGDATSYVFRNVQRSHTIRATFALVSNTIIATAGRNGMISPAGRVAMPAPGGSQLFMMVPAEHYHISDVLVDGISVGAVPSYLFTNVLGQHTIQAMFALDTNPITASAEGNGSISPNGIVDVEKGGAKTFTMTPAEEGYHVADVVVDGESVGAVRSYTFADVTAPHTISARFAVDGTWKITTSTSIGGIIHPAGEVAENASTGVLVVMNGNNQTFTITPEKHYYVGDLLVDGVSVDPVPMYTFTNVTADHTIAAVFSPVPVIITASANANGSISPVGEIEVPYGGSQTYTISADTGYVIYDICVDGRSMGARSEWTFNTITRPHTIKVIFVLGRESGPGDGDDSTLRRLD